MPAKMYYLFLEPMQMDALKQICDSYFRESRGSGFQKQAQEVVQNAKYIEEITIDWEETPEDKTISTINEPDWAFRWALRNVDSLRHDIITMMSRYLSLKREVEKTTFSSEESELIAMKLDGVEPKQIEPGNHYEWPGERVQRVLTQVQTKLGIFCEDWTKPYPPKEDEE